MATKRSGLERFLFTSIGLGTHVKDKPLRGCFAILDMLRTFAAQKANGLDIVMKGKICTPSSNGL